SKANLCGTDLREANLSKAILENIQVEGANFQNAILRGIPWLLIMDLTFQPVASVAGIQWDQLSEQVETNPSAKSENTES
ncbi:MAG TPA: pentapeptide repeat-containing protein, partial [Ktedonobacteraceae bacterium]|nr:pentapeptide repeat-containing protein [Ktedonobacteraceae bacterium]